MRWQQVVPQPRAPSSRGCGGGSTATDMAAPSPRGAHGFGYIDGKVVVFGGYGPPLEADALLADGGTRPEQPLDDLFFLHLRCIQPDAGALLPLCRGHGVLVFVSLFRWTLPL